MTLPDTLKAIKSDIKDDTVDAALHAVIGAEIGFRFPRWRSAEKPYIRLGRTCRDLSVMRTFPSMRQRHDVQAQIAIKAALLPWGSKTLATEEASAVEAVPLRNSL